MNWLDTFPGRRKEPGSSFPGTGGNPAPGGRGAHRPRAPCRERSSSAQGGRGAAGQPPPWVEAGLRPQRRRPAGRSRRRVEPLSPHGRWQLRGAIGMNQYGIVLVGQLRAQGGQAAHGGLNIPGEGATGKQGGFPGQSRAERTGVPRTWRGWLLQYRQGDGGVKSGPWAGLRVSGCNPPGQLAGECHGEYNPP